MSTSIDSPKVERMMDELARKVAELDAAEHGFAYFDPSASPRAEGRLTGWIIPAKDLYDVEGMPTTFGSIHRTRTATDTEPFLQQLLAAGAIIPGKSAVPELGLTIHTEPVGLPAVDNPLYPGRTPGGSSGGAAVMVARGLVRAAHASDGGGSIRVPAAATGTVGFMPTHDGLSAQGFITRSVVDQAFLHGIRPEPRALRIGVLTEPLFATTEVHSDWLQGVHEAADALADAGHSLRTVTPWPHPEETFSHFQALFSVKLAQLTHAKDLAAWLREMGRGVSASRLAQAQRHAAQLASALARHWEVDALLTPMLTSDPPAIGAFSSLPPADNFRTQTQWSPWASTFNVAGTSAISVPWDIAGRPPVAIHLGALTVDDATVLGVAGQVHA